MPKKQFAGPTILVVWCRQCTAEGRRHPGRLGHLEKTRGHAAGEFVWIYAAGAPKVWGKVRRAPAFHWLGTGFRRSWPLRLKASCPFHGTGSVSAAAVLSARGTVVLSLLASA